MSYENISPIHSKIELSNQQNCSYHNIKNTQNVMLGSI